MSVAAGFVAGRLGAAAIGIAGVIAAPQWGFAQTTPGAPPAMHEEAIPAAGASASSAASSSASGVPASGSASTVGNAPAAVAPATSAPTASATSTPKPKRAPAKRHTTHHVKRKPPSWVLQSKVQLAMEADVRFKNVHVTVTQPGVVVLEGQVFDRKVLTAAGQTAAGVEGVKRVINALTTQTLNWLDVQNRANTMLAQAGYKLVLCKVIGNTAYLSGQVPTDLDKQKAETIVLSAAPGLRIGTNLITISR
jgi:hypothetical protein